MSFRRVLVLAFRLRTAALSVTLGLLACSAAFGHGIPIGVDVVGGKLTLTTGEDINGLRVIFDNAQTFNAVSGRTTAPGLDFALALQDATIKMRVLQNLIFWDKTNGFGSTTPAELLAQRLFGTFDQTNASQTGIADAESIIWDNDAKLAGTDHVVRFEVPASSPAGAYGLLVQFEDVTPAAPGFQALGASLYSPTDPFLIVFNQGLDTTAGPAGAPSEYRLGVNAVAAAAVPEPASAVAFAIGAVVLGAGLWRRRRNK